MRLERDWLDGCDSWPFAVVASRQRLFSGSVCETPVPSDISPEPSHGDLSTELAPTMTLSHRTLTLMFLAACLLPLLGLSGYAMFFGKAHDVLLDIEVMVAQEPVETAGGRGAVIADVVVLRNTLLHELPNLTLDINGQYFLYRDSPVQPGERLVFPQAIFATKSNQRWVPGRYPIKELTVTAKLPSGKRGVLVVESPHLPGSPSGTPRP